MPTFIGTENDNTNGNYNQSNNNVQRNLQEIKDILAGMSEDIRSMSQANARSANPHSAENIFRDRRDSNQGSKSKGKSKYGSFSEGFEEAFKEAIFGSDYKKQMKNVMDNFAKQMGMSLEDIPGQLGNEVGNQLIKKFRNMSTSNSKFSKIFDNKFTKGITNSKYFDPLGMKNLFSAKDKTMSILKDSFNSGASKAGASGDIFSTLFNAKNTSGAGFSEAAKNFAGASKAGSSIPLLGSEAATTAEAAVSMEALIGGAEGVAAAFPQIAAAAAPLVVGLLMLDDASEKLFDIFQSVGDVGKALFSSMDKNYQIEKKMAELGKERMKEDWNELVKRPFKILEDAAQKLYDAWDSNIRTINQTQGYNKADLQDLISSYAQRLRDEGLSNVVSSADITSNLESVLKQGLSGRAAEEFSYIATILNAAVPTQDFFNYADSYSALAANAIKNGASQSAAIEYANQQLELFASNVLYSSRQLAGGFTTGLKDAGNLFSSAVQIAQASKTGNPSEIAGVMTAVSAVVGSIAPDLASSMTDVVLNAATGGNASELVALRSLAGVNASNTEFLKQLANNPQKIFSTLFKNLAAYQNMSDDAFMEVAEGLSSVFGVSMQAFSRIDFNYLAKAIDKMNVSNASLEENLSLLTSGESTTSAEMMRMQQINKYMIDEGLAYVLDNEAAREIQRHMWDEQMKIELMENEYAVNLKGEAAEAIKNIGSALKQVLWLMSPVAWVGNKVGQLASTVTESLSIGGQIKSVLEAGKVGTGNKRDLKNLTTYGKDLGLTSKYSYGDLLASVKGSSYGGAWRVASTFGDILDTFQTLGSNKAMFGGVMESISNAAGAARPSSMYSWSTGGISKSFAKGVSSVLGVADLSLTSDLSGSSNTKKSASVAKLNKMLSESYMYDKFIKEGKSYEDWAASASKMGIRDLSQAIEDAGYTQADIQDRFSQYQTQSSAKELQRVAEDEQDFRDKGRQFYLDQVDYDSQIVNRLDTINTSIQDFKKEVYDIYYGEKAGLKPNFVDLWKSYVYEHKVYDKGTNNAGSSANLFAKASKAVSKDKDSTKDAIYALAEALSSDATNLIDPQIQTNALLAKILLVLQAILQQEQKTEASNGFVDSLMALVTGSSPSSTSNSTSTSTSSTKTSSSKVSSGTKMQSTIQSFVPPAMSAGSIANTISNLFK